MGFFKKKEVSPEEQAVLDEQKIEKERIRKEKVDAREAQRLIDKAARAEKKEAAKAADEAKLKRFFGPTPGFDERNNFMIYSNAIDRINDNLLQHDEEVLANILVEYDTPSKKEVKGILVATNQKLVYSSNAITKELTEIMDYKSMTGISLSRDGLLKKELHVTSSKEKRIFDDIKDNDQLDRFMEAVRKQISIARSGGSQQVATPVAPTADKYEQLEKLAGLKEKGVLSEEEFQAEKAKLLAQ